MTIENLKQKISTISNLPQEVLDLINNPRASIKLSAVNKKHIIRIYEIRLQENESDPNYANMVKELRIILEKMRESADEQIYVGAIITSQIYNVIFINEGLDSFLGLLDLSGLGNTRFFMHDEDFEKPEENKS